MASIFSFVNLKNNSGKTTLAINFSYILFKDFGKKVCFIEINENKIFDSEFYLKSNKSHFYNENLNTTDYFLEKDGLAVIWVDKIPLNFLRENLKNFDFFIIDFPEKIEAEILNNSEKIFLTVQLSPLYLQIAQKTIQNLIEKDIPVSRINIIINKSKNNLIRAEDVQDIFAQMKIIGILPYKKEVEECSEKGEIFYLKNKKDVISITLKKCIEDFLNNDKEIDFINFEKKEIISEKHGEKGTETLDVLREIKLKIKEELFKNINIKEMELNALNNPEKKAKIFDDIDYKIRVLVDEKNINFLNVNEKEILIKDIFNEVVGLGVIEDLLKDPQISEIMVNGYKNIYIEKQGKIIKIDKKFSDDAAVLKAIERIVIPLGRRIDESMPYVDARLSDGSRVNAIIPPLAIDGPTITIRKFSNKKLSAEDLINFGSISKEAVDYLKEAVIKKKNILISGGTGSGKTTLLNVLSSFIPDDERIITIEDSAELKLLQEHVVRLEARPANIEGKGEITIRDLVKNALRMRPDRIIVGECRSGETLDMLQAMNTGHEGSMTTVHANSPRDALSRIETMVLMAGVELPLRAIREQIKGAIDIIIQQSRLKDGSRKVTFVSEITGMDGDVILMHNIFEFIESGMNSDGKIMGEFKRVDIM